jgi:dTDP-4-amino-4,6-dideoxygalactose transaminase
MTHPNRVPFLDLPAQHAALRPQLEQAFGDLITQCNFVLGEPVGRFEQAFAAFVGVRHAIGVANGLDALCLALRAVDVGPGDEVIVPANTFIATALAVSQVGAKVVLVDCDAHDFNLDVSRIEQAITPRTKAIIPVHLTGLAADMDPIMELAGRHGLKVIEDAAQAAGTTYKGRPCGSLAHVAAFSFYPGKNLGACGDAGGVTTNDDQIAARVRRLRNYGQEVKYVHVDQGVNSRLDTLQAAILTLKLAHLADWNRRRFQHAQSYRQRLQGVGDLVFQRESAHSSHIYHLFILQTERRDALQKHLQAAEVDTIIHYPIPVHLQKAYVQLGHRPGDFPVAERLAQRILSLPMYPELSPAAIERVVAAVKSFY